MLHERINVLFSYVVRLIHALKYRTRRKIVEVILLNFRINLGHMDKLEVI